MIARSAARHALVFIFAWVACVSFAQDGPYVLREAAGGWQAVSVERAPDGELSRRAAPVVGGTVEVPAVAGVPAFRVAVREPPAAARDELRIPARSPVFVVADTHGEYEILVAQLRKHGIVDDRLTWRFGRGHLVVLGDVFDRGPHHTEILWLLYKLEAEAARAGGGSHLVLGNHEAMVLGGDLRYLHPRYVVTTRVLDARSYSELFGASTLLGQWLRSRPAMLKINEHLYLHGGVSRALVDSGLSLAEINAGVRAALSDGMPLASRERAALLMGSHGPLWYRGYFPGSASAPEASAQDIDRVLAAYAVKRIFVGHTIVPAVTPLYGGKVIAVQVYPKREADGEVSFESLLIQPGKMWRASLDGLQPLDASP